MRPVRSGVCRFLVFIGNGTTGKYYNFRLIQNDDEAKVYRLTPIEDRPRRKRYHVGHNNVGYFCDCDDNRQRKPEGGCKHIKAFIAGGLL